MLNELFLYYKLVQLLTLTDRKTRYEIIRLIPDKTADSINEALMTVKQNYLIKSLTADNGSDFMKLDVVMDCPIYYAHPFSSYERGSNENANRLIRRWFPRGTTTATSDEMAVVQTVDKVNFVSSLFFVSHAK